MRTVVDPPPFINNTTMNCILSHYLTNPGNYYSSISVHRMNDSDSIEPLRMISPLTVSMKFAMIVVVF